MKRIFMCLMVLVIMFISIGGCFWWDEGHGRGGGRGGGESHGGGGGHGGRHY